VSARRRLLEITPPTDARVYLCEDADHDDEPTIHTKHGRDWFHDCTREHVAAALGVTRQRVEQIEEVALEKVGVAFEIEGRLGHIAAVPVLTGLRGQPLSAFRQALEEISSMPRAR
jgi:hypothetical protein